VRSWARRSQAGTLEHWRKALADEPGVWAALATPKETLNDPQVEPNGYTIANVDDQGTEYQIVAAPVQFNETPPAPARAPEHGQHPRRSCWSSTSTGTTFRRPKTVARFCRRGNDQSGQAGAAQPLNR